MNKYAFILISVLAATGSQGQDAEIQKKIVGKWEISGSIEVTFATNGTFVSRWTLPTNTNVYHGTWAVENGILISKTNEGTNHFRIIKADGTNLIYDANGGILPLRRK